MIHFTKYAEQKFDLLNRHRVFITKEQVEDVLRSPETVEHDKRYGWYYKDGLRVVCRPEGHVTNVITFYPVKR